MRACAVENLFELLSTLNQGRKKCIISSFTIHYRKSYYDEIWIYKTNIFEIL